MKHITTHILRLMAAVTMAITACTTAWAQKDGIKVVGTVTDATGTPLESVAVIDVTSGETIGTTDAFGFYSVTVAADATLKFSCLGYKEGLVPVKGRQKIDERLYNDVIKIEEVVVAAKAKRKVISPEPTDIEVKGNYFYLRTRVRVPRELFSSDTRLVVQPSIYNANTGKRCNMRPLVFEGQQYNDTQARMYDFDPARDPLNEFVAVKETRGRMSDLVPYSDSIYVERPDDDYRADVKLSLEDYNRILLTDTFTIAKGTVNPLRLLDYELLPKEFNDSAFIPQATMQLMDSHGEVNLTFIINKNVIDPDDPNNKKELDKLKHELQTIENDKEASMRSLSVKGIASPDGRYSPNLSLARRRTETALNSILNMLGESTRNSITTSSDAEVRGWEAVAEMLRADSFPGEAMQVEDVIKRHSDRDTQSKQIARLSCYRPLITDNYLPRLRKVEYTYEYSIFRYMTDGEILALYAKDYKQLTANEFYRLIMMADDAGKKEEYCRRAIERFPKFLIAANELSCLMMRAGKPDSSLLASFIGEGAPQAIIYNQALCLLMSRRISDALDVIGMSAGDDDDTALLNAIIEAESGYYEKAFGIIAATSEFNEVLMLLAMKKDEEAWAKAQSLNNGTAKELYVKAIAANRTDNIGDALLYMQQAFALDPALEELAKIDGDLLDLMPEGQKHDMNE